MPAPKQKPELERDLVSVWRRRRDRSIELRRGQKQIWDKNRLSFLGKLKPKETIWAAEDPWVSVELVHSAIRAALPSLLYANPKFRLTPRKPDIVDGEDVSWEKARSAELWLQHVWNESEANTHIRCAITSAFLDLGACKFGFAADYADDEMRGVIEYDDAGAPIIDRVTDEGMVPRLTRGEFLMDEDGELIYDEDTNLAVPHPGRIQREQFFVEWISADSVLFDPEGGNVFKGHDWVIEEWTRKLDQVKADPRIPAHLRNEIRANSRLDTQGELKTGLGEVQAIEGINPSEVDDLRVTGFDVYDFVNDRYYVVADNAGDEEMNDFFLVDRRIPVGLEKGPLRFLKFNETPGEWYQKTDAEGMAKLELEYNITRSQLATHRNQSRARYLEVANNGFAGANPEVEREKFLSGRSGVVVQVKSPDGIVPARKDAVGNDFFAAIPQIKDDFREVSGQPGGADTVADADTATQASLLSASADVRNNDRRDNLVATFITDIGRGILQSAAANVTEVQFVKVRKSDEDPLPFEFKQINPEDLAGEYDVEVVIGSTAPKNSQKYVQQLQQLVLLISQNPIIGQSTVLMKRMFDAIDFQDDKLIAELKAIGEQAAQAAGQAPAGGGTNPTQTLPQQNANQNGSFPSGAGGSPTGAPIN